MNIVIHGIHCDFMTDSFRVSDLSVSAVVLLISAVTCPGNTKANQRESGQRLPVVSCGMSLPRPHQVQRELR